MATRRKAKGKTKAKSKKKKTAVRRKAPVRKKAKKVVRKKVARKKKVGTKTARRKPALRKKAAAKKPARKPASVRAPAPKPAAMSSPIAANEFRVGIVTHYFSHLNVAVVQMETGSLREGDTIRIKGHTSDFRQRVGSMEVDHVHVADVRAGQSFGLKVSDHAREHDVVYRVGA